MATTPHDLSTVLLRLRRLELITGSRRALARSMGVSASYLGDVMNEKREPGPSILAALKLERAVRYVPISREG